MHKTSSTQTKARGLTLYFFILGSSVCNKLFMVELLHGSTELGCSEHINKSAYKRIPKILLKLHIIFGRKGNDLYILEKDLQKDEE